MRLKLGALLVSQQCSLPFHIEQARVQDSTLRWAKIAGWAGIASAIVSVLAIIVTIWLAK
jgi:hypothetical protein